MAEEVISPLPRQPDEDPIQEPSFLSVNHGAQRESGSEFGFISDAQWKPEGQFESLPALTDKYALCFQRLFCMKRALIALRAFNALLKTLRELRSAGWRTGCPAAALVQPEAVYCTWN